MSENTGTVQIPALTLLILTSRANGYPLVDQKDIPQFIHDHPLIEVELPIIEDDNEDDEALEEVEYAPSILQVSNKSNKSNSIISVSNNESDYDTLNNMYVDFGYDNKDNIDIIKTATEFGLINEEIQGYCDIDTYVSIEEFLFILARSIYNKGITNKEYNRAYKKDEYSPLIANLYEQDKKWFTENIKISSYDKSITYKEVISILVHYYFLDKIEEIQLDELYESLSEYDYIQMITSGKDELAKSIYFAESHNLLKTLGNDLDTEASKLDILTIIIRSTEIK